MNKSTTHPRICHPISGQPHFDRGPAPVLNAVPLAVRRLTQRYGMSDAYATAVVRLSGMWMEESL
ncbi:hypothetical protein [Tardiphaga robiniae]|uniref:Uncharacterized protein n=1 Tax=Tardiphaga robiniae TaxID=943830 RepID=A0A109ZYF2_9BRAD|nr:hypothetical protein [Tardiphaga robiniae]AMH39544.1 hypothetical protein PROKKA_00733 [Tardiphaga robiniae]